MACCHAEIDKLQKLMAYVSLHGLVFFTDELNSLFTEYDCKYSIFLKEFVPIYDHIKEHGLPPRRAFFAVTFKGRALF